LRHTALVRIIVRVTKVEVLYIMPHGFNGHRVSVDQLSRFNCSVEGR